MTIDVGTEVDPRVRRTHRDVVRAAAELLLEGGWSAVTHAAVADRAGYSKATLYNHWPEPADLGRAAFVEACPPPRYEPVGHLRTDLVGDLAAFADALTHGHVGRILAALAERAPTDPTIAELLASFVREGEDQLRQILDHHGYADDDTDTMLELLSGAVVYRVVFRQLAPTPEFVERVVDRALASTADR